MTNLILMPATTGTRALGIAPSGSWSTSDLSFAGTYAGTSAGATVAPNHQLAGVPAAVSARPNAADVARKRGRPPRGEPR